MSAVTSMSDEQIIITYGKTVYAVAFNYVRNRYDADDIYSETFLRYFKKERRFASEEHRKAYLIRMAINCAKDFLSSKQRSPQSLDERQEAEQACFTDTLCLRDALNALAPEERNLIYLFYYQQYKSAEIAQLLDITDDNVRTRLKRAREKLGVLLSR